MTPPSVSVHIGVFDSGLGGLSVLRALRAELPAARLSYLADSGHAPYGERDPAWVTGRSARAAAFLRSQGAQMLVIACNTATAAAVSALRQAMPDWPIVGIEPGIKPALAMTRNSRIGVMATRGTLESPRFATLQAAVAATVPEAQFSLQACVGLAQAIELHPLHSPAVDEAIALHTQPLNEAGCDVVVLGCTHYPLVADRIQQRLAPGVQLVDTSAAVARRTASLAAGLAGAAAGDAEGDAALYTTGDPARLEALALRWAGVRAHAQAVEI